MEGLRDRAAYSLICSRSARRSATCWCVGVLVRVASHVIRHHVTRHTTHVNDSYVTRHTSHITHHTTRHTSHVTFCRSAATLTTSPFAYIPYRVSFLINQSLNVKNVIKITQDVSLAAVRALDCSPPNDARASRGAQSSISTSISAGVRDTPRDASLV